MVQNWFNRSAKLIYDLALDAYYLLVFIDFIYGSRDWEAFVLPLNHTRIPALDKGFTRCLARDIAFYGRAIRNHSANPYTGRSPIHVVRSR